MLNKNQIIPIFFSTDDNYVQFLDVAVRSLIKNASKDFQYKIIVLNTGLKEENTSKIKALENENFKIEFPNISAAVESLKAKLPNLYHFGLAAYYRLFIQSLYPEFDKILYLDCDIAVEGDISKLFATDVEGYLAAGVVEQFILRTSEFSKYTKEAVGVDAKNYINSGIMVMNLKEFRNHRIEEKFSYLISKYNFDVIDPDQAYINFLCQGKIKYLDVSWNRTPLEDLVCERPNIVHYALYKKPWQYDDVFLGEHFWNYAKESPFFESIKAIKEGFDDVKKAQKERAGVEIKEHGLKAVSGENNFVKVFKAHPEEVVNIFGVEEKQSAQSLGTFAEIASAGLNIFGKKNFNF